MLCQRHGLVDAFCIRSARGLCFRVALMVALISGYSKENAPSSSIEWSNAALEFPSACIPPRGRAVKGEAGQEDQWGPCGCAICLIHLPRIPFGSGSVDCA
eukprot:5457603-Pyramimonas_sp.AAC.1